MVDCVNEESERTPKIDWAALSLAHVRLGAAYLEISLLLESTCSSMDPDTDWLYQGLARILPASEPLEVDPPNDLEHLLDRATTFRGVAKVMINNGLEIANIAATDLREVDPQADSWETRDQTRAQMEQYGEALSQALEIAEATLVQIPEILREPREALGAAVMFLNTESAILSTYLSDGRNG